MITKAIRTLVNELQAGTWKPKHTELFAGADIIICNEQPDGDISDTVVVSKYAEEISSLIFDLKDIFSDYLDAFNKYEFYGRLAECAVLFIQSKGDEIDVLESMMNEAAKIADEWFRKVYFAYGSNMDRQQMTARCPSADFIKRLNCRNINFYWTVQVLQQFVRISKVIFGAFSGH